MQKEQIKISTEYIAVDQLLKFAGIVENGGCAHNLVINGKIKLNGNTISEKRRKIRPGDIVTIDEQVTLEVI